ncbi:hypothetical protein [Aquimarina sp. MMG016]|uniref:hypothetical protein n=1 Tax=Aquimarina sp. MMG016 TaxID=2822690 RepID=UPI001B3A3F80|nr:hypothetical protein [Aquimarina sp. MMG016]MBQ4822265.1 hypothetical protein [Aquimarina sp. MMG016]
MKNTALIILFLCTSTLVKAQVDPELILALKKGTTTEIAAISTANIDEGYMIYDTDIKAVYVYNGTTWRKLYFGPLVNAQTGNYTLQASDDGNVLTFTSATDVTLTIPAGLPIGFNVSVYQQGAGQVQVTGGGGVIVQNRLARFFTAGTGAGIGIIATGTDVYNVTGDLKKN